MLKDNDMRAVLINELNRANTCDYRVIEELAVCDGDARVDVAVANDRLCGYEIKSDADTLKRLALQQKSYDKTFDAISIVVGEKFKDDIEEYIPDYWGVYVVCKDDSGCKIKMRRAAKENKNVEAESLLELLWKEELIKFLKDAGVKGISGKNRRLLRQMAIDNFTLKDIVSTHSVHMIIIISTQVDIPLTVSTFSIIVASSNLP